MSPQTQSSERLLDGLGAASRRRFVLGLGVGLGLLSFGYLVSSCRPAQARDRLLDQARAAGIVGERYDGYALVRDPNASADVRNLVAEVNAKRKQVYEARAASEGVSVGQVGRVYAQEILEAAPPDTWFLLESGEWVKQ